MKTIKEWLNELPEPYRSQALGNMEAHGVNGHETTATFQSALAAAFVWDESPEGRIFWQQIGSGWLPASITPPSEQLFTREDMKKAYAEGLASVIDAMVGVRSTFDEFMQINYPKQ